MGALKILSAQSDSLSVDALESVDSICERIVLHFCIGDLIMKDLANAFKPVLHLVPVLLWQATPDLAEASTIPKLGNPYPIPVVSGARARLLELLASDVEHNVQSFLTVKYVRERCHPLLTIDQP